MFVRLVAFGLVVLVLLFVTVFVWLFWLCAVCLRFACGWVWWLLRCLVVVSVDCCGLLAVVDIFVYL